MIEIVPSLGRWPRVTLGELCDIRGGFPAPQEDAAFENGEVPFVRMKDVGRHHFTNDLRETEQSLSRTEFEQGRYQLTPRGSILMPRSGSVGLNHRAVLTVDAVIVSHLCALVPISDKITTDFLYRFLCLADMRKLTKKTTGLDSIAFSDLRMVAIPLPPLAEQRRIAEVLDRAEALRAKRRAALAQLDSLTQSLFLDLFGDPVRHQAGKLPTVRDAISQGKILEIQDGNHGEKHPKVEEFSEVGIPFITANCLNDDRLDLTTCYFLSPSWLKRLRIGFSQEGDVLLSHKGSIGLTAVVPPRKDPLILSPQVTYYRPSPESLLPQFLRGFFQTDSFQANIKMEAEQTTRSYLGITRQLDLPILLPPIEQQREFARRVTAVEKLKAAQRASLAEIDALFTTLQHRAFRGEL